MRILGLDFGSRTVGTALSDELLLTAQPLEIIRRKEENHLRRTLSRIDELCKANDVRLIVIGLPLNMDETEGERVRLTREFGEKVRLRTNLPIRYIDERLTTVEAEEAMAEMGISSMDYKKYVDMLAAVFILREYLENHKDPSDLPNDPADRCVPEKGRETRGNQ